MDEKKPIKISLSTFFLILAIIIIIVMAFFIYKLYTEKSIATQEIADLNTEVSNLENTINDFQQKIDSISNTTNSNTSTNISNDKEEISTTDNVSYIIAQVEDTSANGLSYKMKMITDKKEIKSLMNIIDSAKQYEAKSFIPNFGDIPPILEVYLANGEKYTIITGDNINDNGNVVNLMTKWYKQDASDKTLFKLDTKLAEYIENLYNSINNSSLASEKEIYKKVSVVNMDDSEASYYNEDFIVLENGKMYFSKNLSDKILEGTYTVDSNNTIDYKLLKETQDYAFYTSSVFKFENIDGKKNIVIDNTPKTMYFQKVD